MKTRHREATYEPDPKTIHPSHTWSAWGDETLEAWGGYGFQARVYAGCACGAVKQRPVLPLRDHANCAMVRELDFTLATMPCDEVRAKLAAEKAEEERLSLEGKQRLEAAQRAFFERHPRGYFWVLHEEVVYLGCPMFSGSGPGYWLALDPRQADPAECGDYDVPNGVKFFTEEEVDVLVRVMPPAVHPSASTVSPAEREQETPHTFPSEPNERHNGFAHYHCLRCGASKRGPTNDPGPQGPYRIRVDAEAFPTCQAALAEQARRDERDAESQRRRDEAQAVYASRLSAFQAAHPRGGYFWVRHNGGAPVIARLDDQRASWMLFGDDEELRHYDSGRSYRGDEYRGFDAVEILAGPIDMSS